MVISGSNKICARSEKNAGPERKVLSAKARKKR
jgi:hypothetical protein